MQKINCTRGLCLAIGLVIFGVVRNETLAYLSLPECAIVCLSKLWQTYDLPRQPMPETASLLKAKTGHIYTYTYTADSCDCLLYYVCVFFLFFFGSVRVWLKWKLFFL